MWTKNGSIPKPETDGTEGWIEVSAAPEAPEGKEVVWWFPPGWVIRDPQPGANWSWSQSEEKWVEYPVTQESVATVQLSPADITSLTTDQISAL